MLSFIVHPAIPVTVEELCHDSTFYSTCVAFGLFFLVEGFAFAKGLAGKFRENCRDKRNTLSIRRQNGLIRLRGNVRYLSCLAAVNILNINLKRPIPVRLEENRFAVR